MNSNIDPEEDIAKAVRRTVYLASKFETAIGKGTEISAAPEAMLVSAHLLAQAVTARRAMLVRRLGDEPIVDWKKQVLRRAWSAAKTAEAKAKSLARDKEWRIWVALRPIGDRYFWQLKQEQAKSVSTIANQAVEYLSEERYHQAVAQIEYAAAVAMVITGDLGYDKITKPMTDLTDELGKL